MGKHSWLVAAFLAGSAQLAIGFACGLALKHFLLH